MSNLENEIQARNTGKALWKVADEKVLSAVKTSLAIKTLRSTIGDAYIPQSRLKHVKKLGHGAFAVVDQCVYDNPNGHIGLVAVKRLKPEIFEDDVELEAFINEAQLLSKLRHWCLVDFLGVGIMDAQSVKQLKKDDKEAEKKVYIVQEFMNKGSLKSLVMRQMCMTGGRLYTNKQGLKWCIQVARGLKYMHDAKPKVIHRDLKMENILLKTDDTGEIMAKIADFGLCAVVDSHGRRLSGIDAERSTALPPAFLSRTQTQESLIETSKHAYELSGKTGSLMYMAPEVLRCEEYNESCDIFSLALIMYEIFSRILMLSLVSYTGEPDEIEKYAISVASGTRPAIPDGFPVKLATLVKKCWAGQQQDRPRAREVVKQLEAMMDDDDMNVEPQMSHPCGCCSIQ